MIKELQILVHGKIKRMEEIIDFVDDNDQVIGSGTERAAHEKEISHRSSAVIIFNSEGRILLTVSAGHKLNAGKYFYSAGGHVKSGESYETAAKRELQEELGIETKLTLVNNFSLENKHGRKSFFGLFKGYFDGEVKPNYEIESYLWLSKEEIKEKIESEKERFSDYVLQGLKEIL